MDLDPASLWLVLAPPSSQPVLGVLELFHILILCLACTTEPQYLYLLIVLQIATLPCSEIYQLLLSDLSTGSHHSAVPTPLLLMQ